MSLIFEDFCFDMVLGFAVLSIIFYRFWTRHYSYWKDNGVPYIEPTFPFGNVGDNVLIRRFMGSVFKDMYFKLKGHKYGGIISLRRPDLILVDPEIIRLVLVKDFNYFTSRGRYFDEDLDPLLAHLFNLSGERWRILRMKLSPTFTSGKMKIMFHLIKACGQELQKGLSDHADKGEIVEMKDYMSRFTTDVIGSCVFGLDINSMKNPNSEFRVMTKDAFVQTLPKIIRDHMDSVIPQLRNYLRVKSIPKEQDEFFFRILNDTVEYREKNNVKRNDFLDLLIQIKNKGYVDDDSTNSKKTNLNSYENYNGDNTEKFNQSYNIEMTKELLSAQCFVFFVAGFDTSSTTLTFSLYELALNKALQVKLQQEIDKVLAKYNGEVTYDGIKEMTYMDQVVQETLRKYSPIGVLTRECAADYKLPDSKGVLKKGSQVIIPLYGLHYDPEYYPDPERFDPERFTEEAKESRPHYTWLPFGEGPRNCIGMRFGILQVKVGLVALLSKYNFDRAPETPVPIKFSPSFAVVPEQGIYLKMSRRVI